MDLVTGNCEDPRGSECNRGTGCGKTARPGLCGGRPVTGVPTTDIKYMTHNMLSQIDYDNLNFFPKVCVKVTGRCNFFCPFCCEPDRAQFQPSLQNLLALSKRLYELGIKRISITGGEPLLHPDLNQFMQRNKEYGIYNLLLTADPFSLIRRSTEILPYADAIRFSIHGIGENHDRVVGKTGAFNKTGEIIKNLTSSKHMVSVTTVVTNSNIECLDQVASWCVDNSIFRLYLFRLLESGLGKSYIEKNGNPSNKLFNEQYYILKRKFKKKSLKIYNYDFSDKPQCIVAYGDGRILCEPSPGYPNSQKTIGNLLIDDPRTIWTNFLNNDEKILAHYCNHVKKSLS